MFTQANATSAASAANQPATAAEQPPPEIDPTILDRLRTEKWSGDINGMVERRYIRALVLYNKTGFFYNGPRTGAITAAMTEYNPDVAWSLAHLN